jgi:hypothetical protein
VPRSWCRPSAGAPKSYAARGVRVFRPPVAITVNKLDKPDQLTLKSALKTRWSKRVPPQQPQVDETNEREFALGGGHAGIPFEHAWMYPNPRFHPTTLRTLRFERFVILRADKTSRLVEEYVRVFLRKICAPASATKAREAAAWLKIAVSIAPAAAMRSSPTLWV